MLRLSDQVHGGELGPGRLVDDHHHFARPGDRVDVDVAEDVLFGQGHEQVAGADDFVDARNPLDAVGHGRHRLSPAEPIDFADAQFATRGQHVGIVGAELRRRSDDDQLLHAGHLGRHGRHQHGRGIGGGAARHANAHPIQRPITLGQISARPLQADVAMQNCLLKLADVRRPPAARPRAVADRPGRGLRPIPAPDTRIVSAVSCALSIRAE